MSVGIIKIRWTGFAGAPGVSQLAITGADATGAAPITQLGVDQATLAAAGFVQAAPSFLPTAVTLEVDPQVDLFNVETGLLEGTLRGTASAPSPGVVAGPYVGPSGACINWSTDTISQGRRIRGRTFIVPLPTAAFAADGTLEPGYIADIQAAGAGMVTASNNDTDWTLAVWGRPRAATATAPARVGAVGMVTSADVPDKAMVLRSRRD